MFLNLYIVCSALYNQKNPPDIYYINLAVLPDTLYPYDHAILSLLPRAPVPQSTVAGTAAHSVGAKLINENAVAHNPQVSICHVHRSESEFTGVLPKWPK